MTPAAPADARPDALAAHQRALLALLRGAGGSPDGAAAQDTTSGPLAPAAAGDDPYLAQVAASPHLRLVHEIARWWRELGVRRACPLTATLLARQGRLEAATARLVAAGDFSPYVERTAQLFLAAVAAGGDPLAAAVARFEDALLRVKRGERREETIPWPLPPDEVLGALLTGAELPAGPAPGPSRGPQRWATRVSWRLPRQFEVIRDGGEPAHS